MINSIVPLTSQRWGYARQNAETTIRARLQQPTRDQFKAGDSEYPPALIVAVIVLMIVVAVAAFYLSALKEVTVTNITLTSLVASVQNLTERNVEIGTLAVLALSEAGSLLFGFASRVISKQLRARLLLRVFQALCVAVAVIANVSITMAHPTYAVAVFDWLITIGAPLLVIGIGLILEELSADWLRAHVIAVMSFNQALKTYNEQIKNPDQHPDFYNVWAQSVLDQLIQQSKHNRATIPLLIEAEPRARQVLVAIQFHRHQWDYSPDMELPELVAVSSVSSVSPVANTAQKAPDSEQKVIDWWQANPDSRNLSQRAMADAIGVSPATVNRALQRIETVETNETIETRNVK